MQGFARRGIAYADEMNVHAGRSMRPEVGEEIEQLVSVRCTRSCRIRVRERSRAVACAATGARPFVPPIDFDTEQVQGAESVEHRSRRSGRAGSRLRVGCSGCRDRRAIGTGGPGRSAHADRRRAGRNHTGYPGADGYRLAADASRSSSASVGIAHRSRAAVPAATPDHQSVPRAADVSKPRVHRCHRGNTVGSNGHRSNARIQGPAGQRSAPRSGMRKPASARRR